MASQDSDHYECQDEMKTERAARYWKRAAENYHEACTSKSYETRAIYIQVAMGWAALATDLERAHAVAQQETSEVRMAH